MQTTEIIYSSIRLCSIEKYTFFMYCFRQFHSRLGIEWLPNTYNSEFTIDLYKVASEHAATRSWHHFNFYYTKNTQKNVQSRIWMGAIKFCVPDQYICFKGIYLLRFNIFIFDIEIYKIKFTKPMFGNCCIYL